MYAGAEEEGADETAEIVPAWQDGDEEDYARAKVAAERAADGLAARLAIVRPGLIVGPGDPTDRFGYWPARMPHVAWTSGGSDTIVQFHGYGPWIIQYLNPADDPRNGNKP